MTSQYNGEHNNNQNEQKSFNQKHITDQVRVMTLLLLYYQLYNQQDSTMTVSIQNTNKQTKWTFFDSLSMLDELISQEVQKPPKS